MVAFIIAFTIGATLMFIFSTSNALDKLQKNVDELKKSVEDLKFTNNK